jgi:hypothetical protein
MIDRLGSIARRGANGKVPGSAYALRARRASAPLAVLALWGNGDTWGNGGTLTRGMPGVRGNGGMQGFLHNNNGVNLSPSLSPSFRVPLSGETALLSYWELA